MRNNITLNLGRSKKKSNNIGGLKVFVCVCLIIVTNLVHIIETLKKNYNKVGLVAYQKCY